MPIATTPNVMRLYPTAQSDLPLRGLYLEERVHELGSQESPFVYANFVTSLDGRIALTAPGDTEPHVPPALTTRSDWQLFQELQSQADCFVTHGGYLRSLASGRLNNILQVGARAGSTYLQDWRQKQGLDTQPGVVVVSASLDFPMPEGVRQDSQRWHIATVQSADRGRVEEWKQRGFEIIFAGSGNTVEGSPLVAALAERGYRSIYLQAGPRILHTMLLDQVLSRLYLTLSHQLIGGEEIHTMLAEHTLGDTGRLALRSLYYHPGAQEATGQFFASFEPQRARA